MATQESIPASVERGIVQLIAALVAARLGNGWNWIEPEYHPGAHGYLIGWKNTERKIETQVNLPVEALHGTEYTVTAHHITTRIRRKLGEFSKRIVHTIPKNANEVSNPPKFILRQWVMSDEYGRGWIDSISTDGYELRFNKHSKSTKFVREWDLEPTDPPQ